MKMECTEALREMYEVSDNRLAPQSRPEAQIHLEECPNCQKLLRLDQLVKKTVRQKTATETVPVGLETRIRQRIQDLENLTWQKKLSWLLPGRPWGWVSTATVMIVTLLVIGIWTLSSPESGFVQWSFEEHAEYIREGFKLELVSSDPAGVDDWFKQNIGFSADARRFQKGEFQLMGGKKMKFAGMTSALACLKKGEVWVSFYAVPSLETEIKGLLEEKIGTKNLWVGSEGKFNIVAWKEEDKNLTCSLVAELPQQELLAFVGLL